MRLEVIGWPLWVGGEFGLPRARLRGASRRPSFSPRGSLPLNPRHPHGLWPWGLMSAYAMRQLSTVTYSRPQWTHQATQRADRERYQRTQTARLRAARDRTTHALQAAQARLQQ